MKTFIILGILALGALIFGSSCETEGEHHHHHDRGGSTTTTTTEETTTIRPRSSTVETYTTRGQ